MHDSLRFTPGAKDSPITDLVLRALQETGGWSVPAMRAPGFRMLEQVEGDLRALAPLPERSQVLVDKAVVEVGLQRLTFVADLLAEGLVYNLSDPLSVTQLEYYKSNKVGNAQRTMSPSARGENFLPDMLPSRLPVYLTTSQFEIDIRTLKMSQRVGMPLDTANVKSSTRSVNEAIEDAAINGATTLDGQPLYDAGYSAPGLLNAPNANTHTITTNWSTATGAQILADIQTMIGKLQTDLKYGPYNLYTSTSWSNYLDNDYSTAKGENSTRDRISKLVHGGRPLRIRSADFMPANTAVLVQMTSDVVDLVSGQMPTVIPWTSLDGFTVHNLVMAIQIPRFRSDYSGNSGVCIATM